MYKQKEKPQFYIITWFIDFRCGIDSLCSLIKRIRNKTILKALNKLETLITYVKDRPGHDLRYAMNPTKIETELGWKPEYNFDSGRDY